jgi:ABC-type multidrug transport system ATPase subunit/peptidoglycan/LPS O-acetylase OafA/YrhL
MNTENRVHALDAVRAFALLLGVAFHAAISFVPGIPPGIWAIADNSPSAAIANTAFVAHLFRMTLFFFIAGYFARLLFQRRGTGGFWANRSQRILVPLIVGWVVLFPAISAVWMWGIAKTFGPAALANPPPRPPMPFGAFPLTHLWFLYYLMLLYVAVLAVRSVIVAADRNGRIRAAIDKVVRGTLNGYWAALFLGVPVALCLYALDQWTIFQGIPTPDSNLIPQLASFVGYGVAVLLGWLVHRQGDLLASIQKRWVGHLVLAALATAACFWTVRGHGLLSPVPQGAPRIEFALAFGVASWSWALAITGIALQFFAQENRVRRYVADSSYWLYLAHLPVVAAFQVWVGRWPLHWSVKFPLVVVLSLAVLFASYHLLVRPTFIGKVLNGRKYPLRAPRHSAVSIVAATPAADSSSAPVAELRGATKRFGKTVALDNVDLQVKAGELLAVLGPNGAGKTTAIGLWLGLLAPDQGTVALMGGPPSEIERRRRVGVMMQEIELGRELRVRELLELTGSYYPNPLTPDQAMELTHTTTLASRRYSKLSGGQKRQVQFALALCGRPELLFLDEPTVGLDVQSREAMWSAIRELIARGCSIVLTTHYLEEAEALADRVVVLAKSRVIASGSVDEMRAIVSRRQIVCETGIAADTVRTWPGVVDTQRDGNRLRITAFDAEAVVRRLLEADHQLQNLEVRQAGLAEAFTALTKEAA